MTGNIDLLKIIHDAIEEVYAHAVKFRFPGEREYRAGLRDAASMIQDTVARRMEKGATDDQVS